MFAQLAITAACLICNYIFTQQRGVAAINSAHLFMKSSHLKSTVPPGCCLQCCQQHSAHIVSIYPDVTAVALQLPSTVTHTHTWIQLIVIYHCVCHGAVRHCADCVCRPAKEYQPFSIREVKPNSDQHRHGRPV